MLIYFYDIEGIRNLFHQDTWWMEISILMFWGDWGETFGANIQTSGATTPGLSIMTKLWLTHCLLWCSFWLLRKLVILHPPYSLDRGPCDFFLFLKMKLKLKGWCLDRIEEIQTELQDVMMLKWNDFQQCFRSWKSCWDRCNNAEVDYFLGDGGIVFTSG